MNVIKREDISEESDSSDDSIGLADIHESDLNDSSSSDKSTLHY